MKVLPTSGCGPVSKALYNSQWGYLFLNNFNIDTGCYIIKNMTKIKSTKILKKNIKYKIALKN